MAALQVAVQGEDYEVHVGTNPTGIIRVVVFTGDRIIPLPEMTPGEAQALAEKLEDAAAWRRR